MTSLFLVSLFFGLLGFSLVAAEDTFFFSQCECQIGPVVPSGDNLVTELVFAGNGLGCLDVAERGVQQDLSVSATKLNGAFDETFLVQGGERVMWYGLFDFRFDVAPADPFTLINFITANEAITFQQIGEQVLGNEGQLIAADGADEYRVGIAESFNSGIGRLTTCIAPKSDLATTECGDAVVGGGFFGDVADIQGDQAFAFLDIDEEGTQTATVTLQSAFFETNVAGLLDVGAIAAEAFIAQRLTEVPLDNPALPLFNGDDFEIDEDNVLNGDLSLLVPGGDVDLRFINFVGGNDIGEFADVLEAGTFVYTPDENFNGEELFSFFYTSDDLGYVCELEVPEAKVIINAIVDDPIPIDTAGLTAIAFVETQLNAAAANDPDILVGETELDTGIVIIETLPASGVLKTADCSADVSVSDEIAVVDGLFDFCYVGDEGNIDAQSDSFEFTVQRSNRTGSDVRGTVEIDGVTPFNINVDNDVRVQNTEENQAVDIVLDSRFVTKIAGAEGVDFKIRIETLPDDGELQKSNGDRITENTVLTEGETITFVPNNGVFNANQLFQNRDGDNNLLIEVCQVSRVGAEVCPSTFTYVAFLGNLALTDTATFNIPIGAVNNVDVEFSQPEESVVADLNNEVNGRINVNVNDFEVIAADEAFQVFVYLVGRGGVTVFNNNAVTPPVELNGFENLGDEVPISTNCLAADNCVVMELGSVPSTLNAFLKRPGFTFSVPVDAQNGEAQAVEVFLSSTQGDFNNRVATVDFEVDVVEDDFFDDQNNILYVAGGVGIVALVGIIVGIFKITSVHSDERGRAILDEEKPKTYHARGNAAKSNIKKKRSFEDDDEEAAPVPHKKAGGGDPLLDWEKHIDPKTKEPFYHNPQTGETVWELPNA